MKKPSHVHPVAQAPGDSRRALLGAPWKVLCPVRAGAPVLAAAVSPRDLEAMAATWESVHVLRTSEAGPQEPAIPGQGEHVRPVSAADARQGRYQAVAVGPGCVTCLDPTEVAGLLEPGGTAVWIAGRRRAPRPRGLRASGFDRPRVYALLPPRTGKIMLPLSSGKLARAGLSFYTPGKQRGRLVVLAGVLLSRMALQRFLGRQSVVTARTPGAAPPGAYLLGWLSDRLGEQVVDATVHSGYRKRSLQLLDAVGRALGVAKVADTPQAEAAVEAETRALRQLSAVPELKDAAPAVLAAGRWAGHAVHVQSAAVLGPGRSPARLTRSHIGFLAALTHLNRREMYLAEWPGWAESRAAVEQASFASAAEASAARAALDSAAATLAGAPVPFHMVHGDFAPWNVGLRAGRITVVDWEHSESRGLPFYDLVHFTVRVSRLLKGRPMPLTELLGDPRAALRVARELALLTGALRGGQSLTEQKVAALLRLCLVKERISAYHM